MNQTLQNARRPDGLGLMALMLVAFVAAAGLLIFDYRSPPLEQRASIEQKLEKQGRFSPEIKRQVPLRALR
ncbi:MAG TPA: hypothetical protein VND93_02035 [Myxococcales bacterium]|nr:hypothetical protein [Myxococcales bacterium]